MLFYPVLKGAALQAYRATVDKIRQNAREESHLSDSDIIVRPLRPQDLSLSTTYWSFTPNTATAWNSVINGVTLGNDTYVGIYGVANTVTGAGQVCQMRIQRENSYARYYPLEPISGYESKIGYLTDPITLKQQNSITIDLWVRSASTVTGVGIIGVVAEKRGILLNPR